MQEVALWDGLIISRHVRKGQVGRGLYQYGRSPRGRPEGIPPKVSAGARGAYEVPEGFSRAVGVGKVELAGHGLLANGVVVNVHWGKGDCVGAFLIGPSGGTLDGVQHL